MKRPDLAQRNRERATHGLSATPAYKAWRHMMNRCYNPADKSFVDYGARGIKVCERWFDVKDFVADMGQPPKGMTLERIDNSLGYQKSNCKWATRKEQNNNSRRNILITHGGITLTRSQWEQRLGLASTTLRGRLRRGWSLAEAMTGELAKPGPSPSI